MPSTFISLTPALTSAVIGSDALVNLPSTGTVGGGYTATLVMLPQCKKCVLNPVGSQTINGASGQFTIDRGQTKALVNMIVSLSISGGNWIMTAVNDNYIDPITPLATTEGGTGGTSFSGAGLAKSGANSDITSLSGLTTPLSAGQGGTGTALFTSGTATFASAGSKAVADATITSSSIVVVTEVGTGAVDHYSVAVSAGVGFTIYSSNNTSTKVVNYIRVN